MGRIGRLLDSRNGGIFCIALLVVMKDDYICRLHSARRDDEGECLVWLLFQFRVPEWHGVTSH